MKREVKSNSREECEDDLRIFFIETMGITFFHLRK
jgi:hypothetical protein